MKKIIAILALMATGMLIQACGGAEKCPAYSMEEPVAEKVRA